MSRRSNRPAARYDSLAPEDEHKIKDMDWCLGDTQTLVAFAGRMVAVRDRRVWGSGMDMTTAFDDAAKNEGCPTIDQLVFVVLPERVFFDDDDAPVLDPALADSGRRSA